jgi:hypothetical protein
MYDAQSLKHEQIASAQTTVVSDGGSDPSPDTDTDTDTESDNTEPSSTLTAIDESTVDDSSTSTSSSGTLSWITAGLLLIALITRIRVRAS